jgi:hypothetical protein
MKDNKRVNTRFDERVKYDIWQPQRFDGKTDYETWKKEQNKQQAKYRINKIKAINLNWNNLERHLTMNNDETALHIMRLMIGHIVGLKESLCNDLAQYHKERIEYRFEKLPILNDEMTAFIKYYKLDFTINAAAYMRCSHEFARLVKKNKGVFLDSSNKHRRKWLDALNDVANSVASMDNLPENLRKAAYNIVIFFANKTYSDFEADNNLQNVKALRIMMNDFERLLHEYIRATPEIVHLMGRKFPIRYDLRAGK